MLLAFATDASDVAPLSSTVVNGYVAATLGASAALASTGGSRKAKALLGLDSDTGLTRLGRS